jgi:hypothetical protein
MEAPKCKSCGERHWDRLCPVAKSSRGGVESRHAGKAVGRRAQAGLSRSNLIAESGVVTPPQAVADETVTAGVASGPREAKSGSPLGTQTVRDAAIVEGRKVAQIAPRIDFDKVFKRGRPLAKDRDRTLEVTKPWVAEGVSRATWYRLRSKK